MEFAVCRLHLKNFPARRLRFPSSGWNVGKPTPGKSFRWFIARSAGICVNSSPQNTIRLLSTECKRSRTFIAGELWLITVRISARNVRSPWQLRLRWHATVAETILSLQRESRFSFCVVCSRYDRLFLETFFYHLIISSTNILRGCHCIKKYVAQMKDLWNELFSSCRLWLDRAKLIVLSVIGKNLTRFCMRWQF